jgi:hypothetical protein
MGACVRQDNTALLEKMARKEKFGQRKTGGEFTG